MPTCGAFYKDGSFVGCGAVQPVNQWVNFFDVFGLVPVANKQSMDSSSIKERKAKDGTVLVTGYGFDIDIGHLKRAFMRLQQVVHPDAHSTKSEVSLFLL
jgi:hypothetical protein